MRYLRFFIFSIKRYLKRPLFLILLALLCISSYAMSKATDIDKLSIRFGYVGELELEDIGPISFVPYDDEASLEATVKGYTIESGFVISKEFIDGVFRDNSVKITSLRRDDSVLYTLGEEIIYSRLVDIYGVKMFEKSVEETGVSSVGKNDIGEIDESAKEIVQRGETYHFEYRWVDGETVAQKTHTFPFKFVAKVLILAVIYMAVFLLKCDIRAGVYDRFTIGERIIYFTLQLIAPIMIFIALYVLLFKAVLK